jgi:glucans biosynthesis protein
VDFAGEALARLGEGTQVEPVITLSRGTVEIPSARPLHAIDGWRAMFDVRPPDESTEPITIRLFLRSGGRPLTETWLYQWVPPAAADRKPY